MKRLNIQQSPYPLAFRVDPDSFSGAMASATPDQAIVRVHARALDGMQKEAVAQCGPGGDSWRLVCDEGPWLNGTDLAPFPLAFFAAGLASSWLSEFMAEAKERLIPVTRLELRQDNFYSMEGSALLGTMSAGVDPVRLRFLVVGDAAAEEFQDIGDIAVNDRSPATAALQDDLESLFAIRANGEDLPDPDVLAASLMAATDPVESMGDCLPGSDGSFADDIIRKDDATDAAAGADAVGLKSEQKRTVHVATRARVRPDGLIEMSVQCMQPAGSRFIMLGDAARERGGQCRAPDPLTYLSCGVAFCYMTQIGRYAGIVKQKLRDYRIVQDTAFSFGPEHAPAAAQVETVVCLDTDEPAEASRKLVQMAEQTCYVHGAYRSPTEIVLEVAGSDSE